jgi:protein-L-isoaspartate(D-aspartate) O-methyltransferase
VLATELRSELVEKLARCGDLRSARVTQAMLAVPRHCFAEGHSVYDAYEDRPLSTGFGQTMSQPTVVAIMTEALDLVGTERVLEIGTGSGYQSAILSLLARKVYSIESLAALERSAERRLARLGHANVEVRLGDGFVGWPEEAPFDRIIATAAPPEVPAALIEQLAVGGMLVSPVGPSEGVQVLVLVRKTRHGLQTTDLAAVRFVPMEH